jgi:hypothetical protein
MHTRTLRIPSTLRVAILGGAALACSTSSGVVDGGPCTIKTPPGTICETTCYYAVGSLGIGNCPTETVPCQIYCDVPRANETTTTCHSADGGPSDYTLQIYPDGGSQPLC